jgi:hypothetical protein
VDKFEYHIRSGIKKWKKVKATEIAHLMNACQGSSNYIGSSKGDMLRDACDAQRGDGTILGSKFDIVKFCKGMDILASAEYNACKERNSLLSKAFMQIYTLPRGEKVGE